MYIDLYIYICKCQNGPSFRAWSCRNLPWKEETMDEPVGLAAQRWIAKWKSELGRLVFQQDLRVFEEW